MKEIEVKLRQGMQQKGITSKAQDEIVQSITSFALYGFPESHAASFALLAYASAYLKCHYLAAFTAALLNNQPMGFYQPFTIIKDAQRHGLEVKPIDITCSEWLCTLEEGGNGDGEMGRWGEKGKGGTGEGATFENLTLSPRLPLSPTPCLSVSPTPRLAQRLGLKYVKGLRAEAGQAIVCERSKGPYAGIDDLSNRVPQLRKDELRKLAAVGALNFIQTADKPSISRGTNRRDALWQVERVSRAAGPLFRELSETDSRSPLVPMTLPERLDADFRGTGLTIGRHPVAQHRRELNKLGVLRAIDAREMPDGSLVCVAGWVIVRQRPGTAKGFVFLSLEDETGVSNIIITPQLFDRNRLVVVDHPFLLIEGRLQNQDNVISVKAKQIRPLVFQVAASSSHDFH
jgi:error-prone DNA polymerase